jgi:hypothetical protein
MRLVATDRSAIATGALAALVAVCLATFVDADSPSGSAALIVGTLFIGIPAYFFVLGIRRGEMVGLWAFRRPVLRRVALFGLTAASLFTVVQLALLLAQWIGLM